MRLARSRCRSFTIIDQLGYVYGVLTPLAVHSQPIQQILIGGVLLIHCLERSASSDLTSTSSMRWVAAWISDSSPRPANNQLAEEPQTPVVSGASSAGCRSRDELLLRLKDR